MATPEKREDPLFVYTCCEVWSVTPLDVSPEPCWVCGQYGQSLNLDEMPTYHKWQRPRYLPKQSTDGSYL